MRRFAAKAAYPELCRGGVMGKRSNLEDRIYESCILKDNAMQPGRAMLDRLAWGTKGTDGLQLLQQLRDAAIYAMHQNHWIDAFESLDSDKDGAISEVQRPGPAPGVAAGGPPVGGGDGGSWWGLMWLVDGG
eukprot:Skav234439  [mRNA]  locus=scaffold1999:69215:73652:- [translate_table: standard]